MTALMESLRQVYNSRVNKAQAELDAESVAARNERDAAMARAQIEYNRRIDQALIVYDDAIREAIDHRVAGMRHIILAQPDA